MKNYSDKELTALIAEVQVELGDILKSEGNLAKSEGLAKAHEVKSAKEANGGAIKKGSMKKDEFPGDNESAPHEESPGEGPEASEGPPPEASASPEASPEASAPQAPGADAGGQPDEMSLEQAYSQLPPEELEMHWEAINKVKMSMQGGPGEQAPGQPPAPGPDASAPMAGEGSKPVAPGSQMAMSEKSEAKITQLEKSMEAITQALQLVLGKPSQKAVTGKSLPAYVAKSEASETLVSETLTKSEITAKLKSVTSNPELKKSDRDLITKYYDGSVKAEKLEHLLK